VKGLLARALPAVFLNALRRIRLSLALRGPYVRLPFSLKDLPAPDFQSAYADRVQKESPEFKRVMTKLLSYVGAGPVGPNKHWEYPFVLRNLDLEPGLRILDAGCGRAPLQYLLAELGMEVHGIDPFENVGWHGIDRRLAVKYGLSIGYRVEGMERIGYPDGFFDRVISVSVLEHVRARPVRDELKTPQSAEDRALQARMIGEMARVLKKGGLLVITLDIMFPDGRTRAECNIDVRNLIDSSGLTLLGEVPEGFYGTPYFEVQSVQRKKDLDIQDYTGVRGTSLGLIFRK
jgi:cyclopropane fatty-acyl-phospholipid synthase-like methyltransferase